MKVFQQEGFGGEKLHLPCPCRRKDFSVIVD